MDDESFSLCHAGDNAIQYFNDSNGLEYAGEKIALIETFEQNYNREKAKNESGLLRVRFLVNCHGNTGRFRLLSSDDQYKAKKFDSSITDQILSIAKSLDGWKPKMHSDDMVNYYQYLIFVIENGHIKAILP